MKEKDRYIVFSIVLFVEILALMIFIYCEGDMWIKKILCNLECVTIGIFLILFPVVVGISIIAKSCSYTGDTVHISKDDLHYKSNFKSAKEIYIDKDVANIPYKYFSDFENLQCIVFEGENTAISENAFEGCTSLERVYLPSKLTKIRGNTFKNCEKLEEISIPDSVTKIGDGTFCGCKGLTSVKIGNGVEEIGVGAFKNCKKLKSVTIPESVTKIGENAFIECEELESVEFKDVKNLWKVGLESIEVSKPMENAKKLKESNYNWYKQQN